METNNIIEILGPMFNVISTDALTAVNELGLTPDADILDVGTGAGNFAIFMASIGFSVLTGEPASDTTHYAGKNWLENATKVGVQDNIRFEAFDAENMPFENNSFDAIFFFGVLHHINEKVRQDAFREAERVAKEKGAIVFFEPKKETLEKVWVNDPEHPLAANPTDYAADLDLNETKLTGSLMDIYVYRKN